MTVPTGYIPTEFTVQAEPTTALAAVKRLLVDGKWRGLWVIRSEIFRRWSIHASEAAISARLRQIRREGWTIERRPKPGRPAKSRAEEYRCPLTKESTP